MKMNIWMTCEDCSESNEIKLSFDENIYCPCCGSLEITEDEEE